MQTVSESALIKRINLALCEQGERVRVCPYGSRWFSDLGRYYAETTHGRVIVAKDVSVAKWAEDLGLINPGEKLAD